MHKIGGAHRQCVKYHYAKFEYKELKTVGITDNTNQTPSKHFWMEKFNTPQNYESIHEM